MQVLAVTYNYLLEPPNLAKGFNRTIDQYSQLNYEEVLSIQASRMRIRADLNRKHA